MKKEVILFSVVIPTYNRSSLLLEALESVFAQTSTDCEVILVDDGSTDSTKKIVAKYYERGLKYYYQNNQGQSAARNHGVEKANGKYVIFMDDDDYWEGNHLDIFRQAIEKDESQRVIFRSGFKRVWADGRQKYAPNYDESNGQHPVMWATYNMCALVCLCIPRLYLIDNISPVGFQHWQDTHLILRLFAQFPIKQLDDHTYCYRIHSRMGSLQNEDEKQLLKRAETNVAAMEDLFEKHGDLIKPFLPNNTLKFLRAEKYIEYANLELSAGNRKNHWKLLSMSVQELISLKFWKHYILFFKYLLKL